MSNLEQKFQELLNEMKEIKENQKEMTKKMSKMQKAIDHIESDIYVKDDFDFEIICPYCEKDFVIDADENQTHVVCPNCNKDIELNWSGDLEDDCSGHCSGCHGCSNDDETIEF